MRNDKTFFEEILAFDHHDVEIQGARTPLHGSHSPCRALDPVKRGKECSRRQRRRDSDHLIEKLSLWHRADGIGLLDFRGGNEACVTNRGNGSSRAGKRNFAITKIGAECDVRYVSHPVFYRG